MKDSLGDRMKTYEGVTRNHLVRRMPVIIRIDGKAFHTLTKGFDKPFDNILIKTMWDTCRHLCANIQGCKIAYTQSDEISLLLTDYEMLETSAWFDNNIQKIVSISASMATMAFNKAFKEHSELCDIVDNVEDGYNNRRETYRKKYDTAMFDSRVFNIPKEDVCNYFIWRQQDATRNSIQMVGQANFSHKQLQNKTCNQIQELLFQEKGVNFNDLPVYQRRGTCIVKENYFKGETIRTRWVADKGIPVFTQDRNYIERYI